MLLELLSESLAIFLRITHHILPELKPVVEQDETVYFFPSVEPAGYPGAIISSETAFVRRMPNSGEAMPVLSRQCSFAVHPTISPMPLVPAFHGKLVFSGSIALRWVFDLGSHSLNINLEIWKVLVGLHLQLLLSSSIYLRQI